MNRLNDYEINCLAMAIVNHTNEMNKVDVKTRQENNDKCFDFAVEKIKEALGDNIDLSQSFTEMMNRRS